MNKNVKLKFENVRVVIMNEREESLFDSLNSVHEVLLPNTHPLIGKDDYIIIDLVKYIIKDVFISTFHSGGVQITILV